MPRESRRIMQRAAVEARLSWSSIFRRLKRLYLVAPVSAQY
jgi:hypothetical protein